VCLNSSFDLSQYVVRRIARGHSRPLDGEALLLEAQLVRPDGHGLGHAGTTLKNPELVRPVVQSVVYVVVEVMEQLYFPAVLTTRYATLGEHSRASHVAVIPEFAS
jgi:hypothetical protein